MHFNDLSSAAVFKAPMKPSAALSGLGKQWLSMTPLTLSNNWCLSKFATKLCTEHWAEHYSALLTLFSLVCSCSQNTIVSVEEFLVVTQFTAIPLLSYQTQTPPISTIAIIKTTLCMYCQFKVLFSVSVALYRTSSH